MSIDFIGYPELKHGEKVVLFDQYTGSTTELSNGSHYQFGYTNGRSFVFIKGTQEYIDEIARLNYIVLNNVYPNPTSDKLNFSLMLPETETQYVIKASIYDLGGRSIKTIDLGGIRSGRNDFQISLRDFVSESGVYIITLNVDTGTTSFIRSQRFYFDR
jgi:hypothetical protein